MHRARSVLLGLVIAAPFYWLLIDTTSSPELIAGGVTAVIAAVTYAAAYAESTGNVAIRLRWLGQGLGALATVPRGILIVCREVLAQTVRPSPHRGRLESDPFPTDAGDRPREVGKRALAEAFTTLAPHTVVIGVDPDTKRMLLHRLGSRE